jgi:hypothetical protein
MSKKKKKTLSIPPEKPELILKGSSRSALSYDDIQRIKEYLSQASEDEKASALSSRQSFFSWLGQVGLGYNVQKITDLTWAAIKSIFGW